ncbi:TM2 domain-containing protein 1 isoform X2 [Lontra canadensis]|uniref:TM2 domain-containing protein 1 isoform X2 n=1 Tax=Lontra canadensis TaxID=76717 RepID=UPI0013F33424|nr:TM2 domain-containing protein 1 isoform X2 [Lontra canadensis]
MAATWPSGPATPEAVAAQVLGVLWFVSVTTGPWGAAAIAAAGGEETLKCEDLKLGQYICKDPKINDATQEPVNCTNYTAHVPCFPAPNITCKDFGGNETHFTGNEVGFLKPVSCRNVVLSIQPADGKEEKEPRKWLFIQGGSCAVSFPWMVGSRSILPWIPCLGFVKVLHSRVLWNWEPN